MLDGLLYTLGLKKKTRTERAKDAFSDAVHSIADALDEVITDTRKEAPRVAKQAQQAAKEVRKEAPKAAKKAGKQAKQAAHQASERVGEARDQASDLAASVAERTAEPREQAAQAVSQGAETLGASTTAMLAALGALTADWDQIAKGLVEELGDRLPSGEAVEDAAEGAKKAVQRATRRKKRGYPRFFMWLLRLGVGIWFIEQLRNKDLSAYIDHEAAARLQRAAQGHPVDWYKQLLDESLIPNASLVGLIEVAGSVLAALGYLTGLNGRLASLLGITISGNHLLADFQDREERSENLVLLLSQLLLLRTDA